jgi:hypothetical protein
VGFEAMPQIADLEIAATWDEIELEAALRSRGEDASPSPSPETLSMLAEALRAVEALKQLPRDERKRRAEELLQALTNAPATPPPEPVPVAPEPFSIETPAAAEPLLAVEDAPAASEPNPAPEPATQSPENPEPELTQSPSAELATASPEEPETPAPAAASTEPATVAMEAAPPSEEPSTVEPSLASVDVPQPSTTEPAAETPEDPEPVSLSALQAALDIVAAVEPAGVTDSPTPDPLPENAASATTVESAATGEADPVVGPSAGAQPDAIPSFLRTECAAFEPEQPDRLIPFRTVAAAGALISAVLLIYFWSSQEFGLAARPILGATEVSDTHPLPPKVSASLAVRRALVAVPEFASSLPAPRPHRPPLVGFEFFNDPAPAAPAAVEAESPTALTQTALVVPPSPTEDAASLPPSPSSDIAALIKRGDDLLSSGDIAAARSAYQRAAALGSAKAQIGVGMTYDPLVLSKLGARGVRGDPVQAASWYARAGESGDEEGQQRLHALISGLSDCMLGQGTCAGRKP